MRRTKTMALKARSSSTRDLPPFGEGFVSGSRNLMSFQSTVLISLQCFTSPSCHENLTYQATFC